MTVNQGIHVKIMVIVWTGEEVIIAHAQQGIMGGNVNVSHCTDFIVHTIVFSQAVPLLRIIKTEEL